MTMEARDLTYRQKLVIRYLGEGLSNREIAEKMYTSQSTINGLLNRLYSKYECRNDRQLLAIARTSNIFHQLNQEA